MMYFKFILASQILNLAFGVRYNISFFQIFLFFRFKITFYNFI